MCQLPFVEDGFVVSSFGNIDDTIDKSSWKKVKFSDVAEEYTVRIDNPSESEFDFFIGSDCIGQYDFRIHKCSDASTITSTQKGFSAGDYLLVRRSLYGSDFRERAPRADFDGVCSADIITIREKKDVVADGFLIYVLYQKSLWDFIVSNSNGGLTRRIKWKQLAEYEFYLPPIEEQKIIADKLWAAYRLKESYKKLLAATEEMVKSLFIEMFGDLEQTKPLSDFIEVSFPGDWGQEDKNGDGVKVIRTTNFTNTGKLDLSDVVTRDIDAAKVEKKKLKKGDIILERSGGTNDNPVGRVVYFDEEGTYLFNNFTQLLRCKECVNSKFLFYSLFNYYWTNKSAIRSMGNKTTGIQNLKMDKYWQIPIADVPLEHQKEFESIYNQADKSGFVGAKSGKFCEYRLAS